MDKTLQTLINLVEIPSVSGDESQIRRALDYVRQYFAGQKVYFKEFNYTNASPVLLIANHAGLDFDVLCVGHLDVVPAEESMFEPRLEGNKLFGRGTYDMKASLVAAMENLEYIVSQGLALKAGILITTDEETTSNGIKGVAAHEKISARIVFDVDAGDLDTIVVKYKHSVGVKIRAEGLSGHSSQPWDGVNAINNLMDALQSLQKKFGYFAKGGRQPKNTWIDTMNITAISSPTTVNVTPAWASAVINFRLTEKMSLEALKKILAEVCDKNACTFEVFMASSGCYMDKNLPYIKQYKKITEKVLGHKAAVSHMCGATDSRVFAGNSTIIMHMCNGGGHHGKGEYVEIDSIAKFREIQREFIDKIGKK